MTRKVQTTYYSFFAPSGSGAGSAQFKFKFPNSELAAIDTAQILKDRLMTKKLAGKLRGNAKQALQLALNKLDERYADEKHTLLFSTYNTFGQAVTQAMRKGGEDFSVINRGDWLAFNFNNQPAGRRRFNSRTGRLASATKFSVSASRTNDLELKVVFGPVTSSGIPSLASHTGRDSMGSPEAFRELESYADIGKSTGATNVVGAIETGDKLIAAAPINPIFVGLGGQTLTSGFRPFEGAITAGYEPILRFIRSRLTSLAREFSDLYKALQAKFSVGDLSSQQDSVSPFVEGDDKRVLAARENLTSFYSDMDRLDQMLAALDKEYSSLDKEIERRAKQQKRPSSKANDKKKILNSSEFVAAFEKLQDTSKLEGFYKELRDMIRSSNVALADKQKIRPSSGKAPGRKKGLRPLKGKKNVESVAVNKEKATVEASLKSASVQNKIVVSYVRSLDSHMGKVSKKLKTLRPTSTHSTVNLGLETIEAEMDSFLVSLYRMEPSVFSNREVNNKFNTVRGNLVDEVNAYRASLREARTILNGGATDVSSTSVVSSFKDDLVDEIASRRKMIKLFRASLSRNKVTFDAFLSIGLAKQTRADIRHVARTVRSAKRDAVGFLGDLRKRSSNYREPFVDTGFEDVFSKFMQLNNLSANRMTDISRALERNTSLNDVDPLTTSAVDSVDSSRIGKRTRKIVKDARAQYYDQYRKTRLVNPKTLSKNVDEEEFKQLQEAFYKLLGPLFD
jgi:hypothetical protein